MQFRELVAAVYEKPSAFVEPLDPIYLGAFFYGYKMVNLAIDDPLQELMARFTGPSQADAWSRAYLHFSPSEAFDRLLTELLVILGRWDKNQFEEGPYARESCMTAIVHACKQGRLGMALGETSVLWLANYSKGFIAALNAWNTEQATVQEKELAQFESWLQVQYAEHQAPWHRIIRVYKGGSQNGVEQFVDLWNEWIDSTKVDKRSACNSRE
jgi:hypothetical protein